MLLLVPWAVKGQDLTDYTFSTGTDENQWITLTDGATTLLANAKDDEVSSKTNIGFTFPFGSGTYTQFWVNSNGVFSFSSSTSTGGSSGQFSSSYVGTAQPKICGIAKDLTTGSNGYVKSELTGTAPNRVLVCEFFTTHQYSYEYSNVLATCKWQVQLYEANSKVVIVYGSAPASAPSDYQIGLGQSSTNFWTVNPSTHTATAQTSAVSTTYSVWPGANRYYAFESPTCFKPQNIHATLTPGDGTIATLTWERNAQGTEDAWVLEYGTAANFAGATSVNVTGGTPSKDLTGLTAEQKYYARVKPDCDTEGNLWSDAISFTPTDAYTITVYDEEGTSTYIPMYGGYFDDYTKSECIIPATELSTIQWGQITSITFYAKSIGTNSSTWTSTNQKVFLKEVNSTTLGGSYSGMDGATIVFDGLLPMPTTSTDGYTITFSQPYTYSGGNLLIGVYNDDKGTYNSVTWFGKTGLTSGVSAYGFNASSLANVSYNAQSFLPKTTFNYTPGSAPDCATPTGLAVTANSQTPEGATITWTAGDASSWIVEYKASTEENYTAIAEPVNEATYTFTGLNYSTTYNARVKVNCTAGSGVSYPTEPVNFTTDVQFPAPTNFETSNLTHNSVTLAWTAGYTNQTAWKVQYKKSSDSWTDAATIVNTPTINLSELVANTAYNVRIYGGIGENFGTAYLSGDFTTKDPTAAPNNFVVSNLTASSATISWTPGYTTQDHWTVEYKKSTEEWAAATTENVTSPTINLDNLDGLTTYNVRIYYVEAHKLFGDFTTAAGLPFTEEFSTTSIPTNWENKTGLLDNVMTGTALTSGAQWSFGTHSNLFNSHARINIYGGIAESNARYGWLITPNITVGDNYSLSFDLALTNYDTPNGMTQPVTPQTTGTDDKFIVLVSTDNEANWTVLRQWDNAGSAYVYNDIAYNGETVYIDLAAYNNQTVRIAFYGESTVKNADNNLHIDNVEVNITNTCYKPTNVASSNVTNHSATITWLAGTVGQELWQLKYNKDADFDPNTEGTAIVVETDPTYTFDKTLDATSVYYVYIRGNCGTTSEPDYGPWSKKCTFSTGAAAPALTTFNKTVVGPNWVDLYWNQSTGDLLSGYGIYYSTTSTAPTAETAAIVTINNPTAPTSEAPYRLTGLTSETTYYIWVRANHETDVYSAWKAITGTSFTTLVACPAPINVEIDETTLTHTTADLSWTGYSDSYTVQKRTAASTGATYLNEGFENNGEWPTGWDNSVTSNDSYKWLVGEGSGYGSGGVTTAANGSYNALYYTGSSGKTATAWLITPTMDLTGVTDAKLSFNYCNPSWSGGIYELKVNYRVDEGEWQLLKTYNTAQESWNLETITLSGMAANYQIGFSIKGYNSDYGYGVGIDDVKVFSPVPAGEWADVATNVTETSYPLTDLTAGTKYDVRVKGNCGGEYSDVYSFTTYDNNTKIFKTDGNWNVAGNWDGGIPENTTQNVIIRANVTIPNGTLAMANTITFEGTTTPTLTIADGGQLQHNNSSTITATVKKNITGYGATFNSETNNNSTYYLIAPPFNKTIYQNNSDETNLRTGTYDLYQWNRNASLEWVYYGANNTNSLSMNRGTGYLYANQEDTEITFTGSILSSANSQSQTVYYTAPTAGSTEYSDWNLIGNPFVCNAYLVSAATSGTALPYYKLNAAGNATEAVSNGAAITPMQGIFYQAPSDGGASQTVYFTRTAPETSTGPKGNLNILMSNTNTRGSSVIDNAIISFGNPNTLGKLNLFASDARVFIPQDGKNYAVAYAESNEGEMPLNFKAEKNGAYTLSFTAEEVDFSYLHLIDKMTGEDIDLLAGASTLRGSSGTAGSATYTFNAKTTDYATRFRLVFATSSSSEDNNFGFINGSGNLCIFGIEGTATLQVIDVTGRILSSETFSGSYEKRINAAPGVYVVRLINGSKIKTQKIVLQ